MLPENLIEELQQRQFCFDQLCAAWSAEYRQRDGHVHCSRGCAGCCSLVVNCTFPEAYLIARNISTAQRERLYCRIDAVKEAADRAGSLKEWLSAYRKTAAPCPFLEEDGSCGVYQVRPISCRSLLSTRPPEWCVTDFALLQPDEKRMFMESLDRSAVAFPTHYAATPQEIGRELEEATMRQMEAEYGFSILGCLPWLVWIEIEHNIGERLPEGREEVKKYLADKALASPYLLIFT